METIAEARKMLREDFEKRKRRIERWSDPDVRRESVDVALSMGLVDPTPHPEFVGYLVGRNGLVLSFHGSEPKLLTPVVVVNSPRVTLYRKVEKNRQVLIKQLLAEVFLGAQPYDLVTSTDVSNPSVENISVRPGKGFRNPRTLKVTYES